LALACATPPGVESESLIGAVLVVVRANAKVVGSSKRVLTVVV
jgi:hypothetical protein